MSEWMTDERLAEYEQLIKGWCPSSDEDDVCVELLQALKAEREYARTLEAQLEAVRGLPRYSTPEVKTNYGDDPDVMWIAEYELEAALDNTKSEG